MHRRHFFALALAFLYRGRLAATLRVKRFTTMSRNTTGFCGKLTRRLRVVLREGLVLMRSGCVVLVVRTASSLPLG